MAQIELVIEELVLHGFDHADGARISEAVQTELARLLAARGIVMPTHSIELARLNAGSFTVQPNANAGAVGAGIARSLHRGLQGAADG
jgi:hypothetical protein